MSLDCGPYVCTRCGDEIPASEHPLQRPGPILCLPCYLLTSPLPRFEPEGPKWLPVECDDCGDRLGFVAGKFEHQGTILCQACWASDQAEAEAVRDADHRSFGGG